MDRRDVLVALGGLYGAAAADNKAALAKPVQPPDLSKCHPATSNGIPTGSDLLKCCPPYTKADIHPYEFPKTTLRVRQPAHVVADDAEFMAKYKEAVQKMKNLPSDHPWYFYQQALIHCAYCNDGYDQVGFPGVPLTVHASSLFPPWHRFYLHFYERILGKLIGDDSFAIPFWNYDTPKGMMFPAIYCNDTSSPLYNPNRNLEHMPPRVLDYQYGYKDGDRDIPPDELIKENLKEMRSAFKETLSLAVLFLGDPLRAGEKEDGTKGTGRLEAIHNAVHQWVGPTASPHIDMGNFVTAARDSSFFSLHSNVDRLWHIYRCLRGSSDDFTDTDWLDATFIFYDENEKVVSVKARDAKLSKLCYAYEEVPLPWWQGKRAPLKKTKEAKNLPVGEFGSKPRKLETTIRAIVPRPGKSRSKSEKQDKVEVLFIEGIQVNTTGAARFDVFVAAAEGNNAGPSRGELVGSYVHLPHSMATETMVMDGKMRTGLLKLGINSVLEDLEAEDSEKLVVSLYPRFGDVTVGGISIKLLETDVSL